MENVIPLQSNTSVSDDNHRVVSLPSSPSAASADVTITLPFVQPSYSLAIQAKRAWIIRNALVASNVGTCTIDALIASVEENRKPNGGPQPIKHEELMEFMRSLPNVRGGEVFHPLEETLQRLYRLFHVMERTDLIQLMCGCLVLVHGTMKEKVDAAFQLIALESSNTKYTIEAIERVLTCLLLAVAALFNEETATTEQLKASGSILCQSVDEAIKEWTNGTPVIAKEVVWTWLFTDNKTNKALPWLKLVDSTKWPNTKRLISPSSSTSSRTQPLKSPSTVPASPIKLSKGSEINGEMNYEEEEVEEEGPPALHFRFSGVDGGILTIGESEATTLFELLQLSAFTKVSAQAMYDIFVQHTGDGLLEEETFLEAIGELVSMTNQPHLMQKNDFLEQMLAIFRCFLPEHCGKVDAFEIAAGFSVFAWGSKSDKLASSFHYFDVDSKGFLNRQQLWRFLRSVLIMLLNLSPPSENLIARYGSFAELVDTGEQEIMENIMDSTQEEEEQQRIRTQSELHLGVYTFEEFGCWYNSGGFKGMSWLELLDLRKWMFVSSCFEIDALDIEPLDPIIASTNYYSAQNIQANVDTSGNGPSPGHFDGIEEEEEEDDESNGPIEARSFSQHSSFASTSAPSSFRHEASINSTMPAILLKNEIVLEFDLALDTEEDSMMELPLSTLSFDNYDLIQYFELQRVIQFHHIELYRLYDVFEPFMENIQSAWMEKSTFDACIIDLLPREIAMGVATAFGIHSNSSSSVHSHTKDAKMVADTLSRLFFAFNRGGTGKIDLIEFLSAFTLFFAGSKSDKLAFTYRLLDSDGDGALSRREMWKYLRSFLTLLLVLGNGSELSAEAIASVADATAIAIADAIFKDTNKTFSIRRMSDRNSLDRSSVSQKTTSRGQYYHRGSLDSVGSAFIRGGVVSFEEFAKWYSNNGYNIIAWIELLDTKKWPQVNEQVADAILNYMSRQQAMTAAAARGSNGPDTGSTFMTSSGNDRVSSLEGDYAIESTPLNTDRLKTEETKDIPSVSGIHTLMHTPNSSNSSRDLSSVALQFKLTSFDNTTLRIRLQDVAVVYTISERLGLSVLTCEELFKRFNQQGTFRSFTKMIYLRSMRRLVPRELLSNEDQEFLSFHLLRMFALFETESVLDEEEEENDENGSEEEIVVSPTGKNKTSSVEKLHLLAGMSIFCSGSKSTKLGTLFKLYDTHGDGYVTRRHLFEMLKSILVILFAFSSYNSNKAHTNNVNSWSTNSAAERAAGAVISKLFCTAKCQYPDAISLAEFANWYAQGGYIDSPWLELLDLSKWPAKEAFEASKREKPLIYAFDMIEEGNILHFTESDISTYLFMLRSTKLGDQHVSKMYDALLTFATPSAEEVLKMSRTEPNDYSYAAVEEDEGAYLVLTRSHYYECIRSLVPKEDMSEKAQQTSSKLLSRLFNVFDRKRCGRVNALELACGMSILGKGSKSQKLAMAFEFITKMRQQRHRSLHTNNYTSTNGNINSGTFGWSSTRGTTTGLRRSALEKETNALPHSVLFIYLRSFLLSLMALSDGTYRLGLEKMYAEADDFIEEAMGDLMTEVAANGNHGGMYAGYGTARSRARVTFEQFGEWYNAGGFELISWVELLDIAKWEQQQELQENEVTVAAATAAQRVSKLGSQRFTSTKQPMEPMRTDTMRPITQKKQIRQSEIVSSSYDSTRRPIKPTAQAPAPLSPHPESVAAASLSSDGPIMVFAIDPEAAELQFFNEDLTRLKLFFHQTELHQQTSWNFGQAMKTTLMTTLKAKQLKNPIEITRGQFLASMHSVCLTRMSNCPDALGEEAMDLLQSVAEVFIKEPTSSHDIYHRSPSMDENDDQSMHDKLDATAVLCGLLVLCKGTLLDKLQCGATIFESNGIDHPVETSIQSLKDTLMCFLMTLYGISCSLSGEIVRFSAQLGVDDVLHAFITREDSEEDSDDKDSDGKSISTKQNDREKRKHNKKKTLDGTTIVSLQDFSAWFSEVGYHSHPWLELADFQHWPKVINLCSSP